MNTKPVDTIKALYASFAAGDIPAVLGALSPNIAWTEAAGFPCAGTYIGPQAVLTGVFMRLGTEWEGYAAVPDSYIDAGDTVVALGHYSGKYNATGKSFRAPFAHIWELESGKPVKFTQYTDTLLVNQAIQP